MQLQTLRRLLFERSRPLWRYCAIAFPLALFPSLLFTLIAFAVLHGLGLDIDTVSPPEWRASAGTAIGLVILAPAVETLLLAATIAIFSTLSTSRVFIAAMSALTWGTLHATLGVAWFFGTFWSFFVFSAGYITWRSKSWSNAFLAAAIPHALINLTVVALLYAEARGGNAWRSWFY